MMLAELMIGRYGLAARHSRAATNAALVKGPGWFRRLWRALFGRRR